MRTGYRTVITLALAAVILGGRPTAAQAAQSGDIPPNSERSYATWFFGRTQVCIKNLHHSSNAHYVWASSTTIGSGGLSPQQETCFARSFVGFRISITNGSPDATLHVRLPIGP